MEWGMWEADNQLREVLEETDAEMETSSQVMGFISEKEAKKQKQKTVWIVGVAGKFIGKEYWKLQDSPLKDSVCIKK